MRILRAMWILFRYRRLLRMSEIEGKKFAGGEVGMLSEYMHDDHDSVAEGVITLGRFHELLTMDRGKLVNDLKRLEKIHSEYIQRLKSAEVGE